MKYVLVVSILAGSLCAQDPTSARDWLNRGVTAFKQAQYAEAIEAFTRAVQADPSFITAHLYLGTAYMQTFLPGAENPQNNLAAANAHAEFQKVLEMDAGNKVALVSDASLYLNQKQWEAAKQGYERVITVDPNNADAYYTLGFIAWSNWYPAYGKARAEAGLKQIDPGPIADPAIRTALKTKWEPVIEEGLRALDRALSINPNYDDAMAYENLLIRERADLRDTRAEYANDIAAANEWVQKALATKKMKAEMRSGNEAGLMPGRSGAYGGGGNRVPVPPRIIPLSKVDPVYPRLAMDARVQGTVVIAATVGTDGLVKDMRIVSGHPLLIKSAMDAVNQWTFPAQPAEKETVVEVPFVLR